MKYILKGGTVVGSSVSCEADLLIDGEKIAAVILEPIQGEAGVIVPPPGYLKEVRQLCDEHNIPLILDEIQTGMGRTGTMWRCEAEDVVPDVMTFGKAFGGGVMPITGLICRPHMWSQELIDNPYLLGSTTFGGNPVCCSAAIATIRFMLAHDIPGQCRDKGAKLKAGLEAAWKKYPKLVDEVRGVGLMLAVEFADDEIGYAFSKNMYAHNVIIAGTLNNSKTIRFEPTAVMTAKEVEQLFVLINRLRDKGVSIVYVSHRLNEIFRQSESSLIVRNAHAINHGEMPVLNQKNSNFFFERHAYPEDSARAVVELCRRRLPAYMKCADPLHAIQVLSPTKKGACGVIALNAMLQAALNPPCPEKPEIQYGERIFRQGDKVMHIKNNYQLEWMGEDDSDGTGVFNGDMGVVLTVDTEEKTLVVFFDDGRTAEYEYAMLEELELAYCLSVHKSQGSEFACVVMPCVGGPPMLLTRNLFYTALTRAKELVVLVGREDAISAMVNNNHIARRYTALCQRLGEIPAGE